MDVVCQTHPNHPAVDVCDRCARTVCAECAVAVGSAAPRCGPCALVAAGVRRRDVRPAASRRTVQALRRRVRASATEVATPGGGEVADPGVDHGSPADDDVGWCSEADPGAWLRRY